LVGYSLENKEKFGLSKAKKKGLIKAIIEADAALGFGKKH
jgi:hypothetical protein